MIHIVRGVAIAPETDIAGPGSPAINEFAFISFDIFSIAAGSQAQSIIMVIIEERHDTVNKIFIL